MSTCLPGFVPHSALSITGQIKLCARQAHVAAVLQRTIERKKARAIKARQAIPPAILERLAEHKVAQRTYARYKKLFGKSEYTIKQLMTRCKGSRQAIFQQIAKLNRAGFVAAVGKDGRDIVWSWVNQDQHKPMRDMTEADFHEAHGLNSPACAAFCAGPVE